MDNPSLKSSPCEKMESLKELIICSAACLSQKLVYPKSMLILFNPQKNGIYIYAKGI